MAAGRQILRPAGNQGPNSVHLALQAGIVLRKLQIMGNLASEVLRETFFAGSLGRQTHRRQGFVVEPL